MPRTSEQIREGKRLSMAKRRAANPSAAREYAKKYRDKNKEKSLKSMRDYFSRRFFWSRAMKLRGVGRATALDLFSIWKKQKGKCALTARKLDRTSQLDHICSKARGGNDSKENLRWLCKEANLSKRELSDGEFMKLCQDVISRSKL